MTARPDAELDARVRAHIYEQFADLTRPPTVDEAAAALGVPAANVRDAYQRLSDSHAIVLRPGTHHVLMAHPFSAAPTPFRVHSRGRAYWPNCAWDALGIAAALSSDARIEARCADCNDALELAVVNGQVESEPFRMHFAIPPRHWWDDIVYT